MPPPPMFGMPPPMFGMGMPPGYPPMGFPGAGGMPPPFAMGAPPVLGLPGMPPRGPAMPAFPGALPTLAGQAVVTSPPPLRLPNLTVVQSAIPAKPVEPLPDWLPPNCRQPVTVFIGSLSFSPST